MLEEYEIFVAVVDHGSLTAAARHLGRSLQSVSRAVTKLEREIGVELVQRSTRRLRVTEAGLAFHTRIKAALAEIGAARAQAAEHAAEISGLLRVGGSSLFAPLHLVPAVAAFQRRHAAIQVELVLDDNYVDLLAERLDLSVRIGELEDSSLMSRRLGAIRRVTFASPSYLAKRGRPASPEDLRGHDCVIRKAARDASNWTYAREGGTQVVEVRGRFRSNSASACNEAVSLGLGIGLSPLWQVQSMLDAGRIELVLCGFEPPATPLNAIWHRTSALPARTRLFIDFLAARFRSERW